MPYRVELASTGRAGCQDGACKKDQVKIEKGALRCGSWVETEKYAGWRWKHWGCVSGKQLDNIRKNIEHPLHEGQYDWDMMDGLQGEDKKDRLPPDDQEKVKRCITQGFIDPEDWNGDPECNVLGKSGIHLTQKQKEKKDEAEDEDGDSPKKSKKRSRGKKADAEESEDDDKPAKKKGKKASRKEEEPDDEKPAKSRTKKSVKEEDAESDEAIPAKKQRGKKAAVKEEPDDEVEKKAVPTKRGKKADVKEEVSDDEVIPVKKQRGKKAAVKEEASDDEAIPVKKQRGKKAAVKEEASDDDVIPVKKQRGKKAAVKKEDGSTLVPGISNAELYAEFRSKLDDDDPDDDYENYVRIRKEFPDAKSMGAAIQEFFTFKYGAEVEKDPELIAKVGKIGKIFEEFLKLRSGYGSYDEMHEDMQAQEKTGEKTKQKGQKTKVKDEPVEETGIVEGTPKPAKRARRSSRK